MPLNIIDKHSGVQSIPSLKTEVLHLKPPHFVVFFGIVHLGNLLLTTSCLCTRQWVIGSWTSVQLKLFRIFCCFSDSWFQPTFSLFPLLCCCYDSLMTPLSGYDSGDALQKDWLIEPFKMMLGFNVFPELAFMYPQGYGCLIWEPLIQVTLAV